MKLLALVLRQRAITLLFLGLAACAPSTTVRAPQLAEANSAAPVATNVAPAPPFGPQHARGEASLESPPARSFDLRASNYAFAVRLYRHLARQPGNLVFSPASIQLALALSYAGAAGETRAEMARTGSLPSEPETAARIVAEQMAEWSRFAGPDKLRRTEHQLAIAMFHRHELTLHDSFRALALNRYAATVEGVDFSRPEDARSRLNAWAERATRGRIATLLGAGTLSTDTGLVLLNALYFRAQWKDVFGPPRPAPFHLDGGGKVQAPMMSRRKPARYVVRQEARVLELEYETEGHSLVILLSGEEEPLSSLEARLDPERLLSWTAFLPKSDVDVVLPVFRIGPVTHQLKAVLTGLGMRLAFDRRFADFSHSSGVPMYIDDIHHGALIDVDQYGTVAAATTAEVRFITNARRSIFAVDRPFLFFVRDNRSGLILFMGRLTNPTV